MMYRLRRWWATRRATAKALRGEPLNFVEVELIKRRFSITDAEFQRTKP